MSKSYVRPAPIKTKILVAIRDNPGLRPFQLFGIPSLKEHKVNHFWLRNLREQGLVVDVNQEAWMGTFMAWYNGGQNGPSPISQRCVAIHLTESGQAWLASRSV